ncbi:MAG: cell wall-binding repeat-containing protein, partial [Acidimicrobiia bacterium]|nr:cell wall-binding repeat-containing protein [Acidimicrobiia bacterium]
MHRFRSISLTAALFVALSVVVAPPASAADDVTITGSGWGHGIGLSQYGAFGQSREGDTFQQILGHYYTGTSTATLPAESERLWVGITQEKYRVDITAWAIGSSAVDVIVSRGAVATDGQLTGTLETLILASGPSPGTAGDRVVIEAVPGTGNGSGDPVDCTVTRYPAGGGTPGASDILAAGECNVDLTWDGDEPVPTSRVEIDGVWDTADTTGAGEACTFTDWNGPVTVNRDCSYSRGLMHIRSDNNTAAVDISVEVDLDDYTLGISEMPYYWGDDGGMEALKAQAVAARSYALHFAQKRGDVGPGDRDWCWCHVYDSTIDQRYVGWGHGQSSWITAVNSTLGVIATHPSESGPIAAYYSSSSGGRTENIEDVWVSDPVPYLKSVDDHWAYNDGVGNPREDWTETMTVGEFAAELGFTSIKSVAIRETFESGSPAVIEVAGVKNGADTVKTYDGNDFRVEFGLYSHYITSVFGEFSLSRYAGLDRYGTAAEISANTFDAGVPVVYIASGNDFPDALVAGPAAAHGGGPVLLVTTVAPTATKDELKRLQPAEIVIIGGTGAVATPVEDELKELVPTATVRRVVGDSRIATSVAVSQDAFASAPAVFVAVEDNFPDALSGSALAARMGGPVLFVKTNTLSGLVKDEIKRLGATDIVVLGG